MKHTINAGGYHVYPDRSIHSHLKRLAHLRGLQNVTIDGDLPQCYVRPLRRIMTSQSRAGEVLPKLKASRGKNGEVDAD